MQLTSVTHSKPKYFLSFHCKHSPSSTIFLSSTCFQPLPPDMKFTTIAALSLSAVVLAQECPAGYSPVVSYITVTLGPESTSTPPPTTTIYHSTTTILTVTTSIASAGSTASTTSSSDTAVATDDAADESVSASSSSPPAATVNAIEESATASSPSTTDSALSASVSGQATFYGGNVAGGACSFSTYTLPSNIFGTALSDSNWANSASCGACVSVTGPAGNSITAMVRALSTLVYP